MIITGDHVARAPNSFPHNGSQAPRRSAAPPRSGVARTDALLSPLRPPKTPATLLGHTLGPKRNTVAKYATELGLAWRYRDGHTHLPKKFGRVGGTPGKKFLKFWLALDAGQARSSHVCFR